MSILGLCDRSIHEHSFSHMTTKALPLLTSRFIRQPGAHIRPVWRFLIPSGVKIPLEVRNACLGRI